MSYIKNIKELMYQTKKQEKKFELLRIIIAIIGFFIFIYYTSLFNIDANGTQLKYLGYIYIGVPILGVIIFIILDKMKKNKIIQIYNSIKKEIEKIELTEYGFSNIESNKESFEMLKQIKPITPSYLKIYSIIQGNKKFKQDEVYLIDEYLKILNLIMYVVDLNKIHEENKSIELELERKEIVKKEFEIRKEKREKSKNPTFFQKLFGIKNEIFTTKKKKLKIKNL
jgi:hypothetical protein